MNRAKLTTLLVGCLLASGLWLQAALTEGVGATQELKFNRDIRPILSDRCFYCHGPDERNRKAGLRLDTFEGATKDRGGYRAIAPGRPEESLLLRRVTSHDPAEVMPPPAAKKSPVTAAEAELLRRWIADGARYEGHWAFQPLSRDLPPAVKRRDWVRNGIDNFILARLEAEGIAPAVEADPRT
ncbi:MAG: c-type cytochrome domain-containing protein, partial [Acidobacteriota bacterium]